MINNEVLDLIAGLKQLGIKMPDQTTFRVRREVLGIGIDDAVSLVSSHGLHVNASDPQEAARKAALSDSQLLGPDHETISLPPCEPGTTLTRCVSPGSPLIVDYTCSSAWNYLANFVRVAGEYFGMTGADRRIVLLQILQFEAGYVLADPARAFLDLVQLLQEFAAARTPIAAPSH
jgi:hypothetical protein